MISNFSVMNQKSIKAKHYGPKNCKSNKDKCRERRGKKSICILSCIISITISFLINSQFGLMATNSRMPNKIIQKLHKPHHNAKKKTEIFDEFIFERVEQSMIFVGEAVKKKNYIKKFQIDKIRITQEKSIKMLKTIIQTSKINSYFSFDIF